MIFEIIVKYMKLNRATYIFNSTKNFCVVYDKHFHYFRNKAEYKNTVVHLNDDLNESKVAGPGFSFLLKEHNIQTDGYFSHLAQRENVMKLSFTQVKDLLFLMANIRIDTTKYASALQYLDEKCALSTERWPLDLSFYILDAWFIIWGPKLFKKHYYSAITSQWSRRISKCSKYNLILMLYYIGMSKTAPPFLMESIEDRIEHFAPHFVDEEWAVACLSFFKTSKRVNSEVILRQSCRAVINLLSRNDRFNAISILKCLRLSKYYDSELWEILKGYSLKECSEFNFVECTNFLAVFAAQNIYDEAIFNSLECRGISALRTENSKNEHKINLKCHPSLRSRVKDVARFLWGMASMGHTMKKDTLEYLSNILQQRIDVTEYETQVHILIDSLQSLALAGCYPKDILIDVLKASTLKKVYFLDRAKPRYQLYFLHKSTQIEVPDLNVDELKTIFNPIPKSLDKDIKTRKGFRDIITILKQKSLNDFACCYLIPHIMISGIILSITLNGNSPKETAERKLNIYKTYLKKGIISKQVKDIFQSDRKYVCIEILDPTVCVNGTDIPIGLMKTKIRQLKKLEFTVITLSTDEIYKLIKDTSVNCKNIDYLFDLK